MAIVGENLGRRVDQHSRDVRPAGPATARRPSDAKKTRRRSYLLSGGIWLLTAMLLTAAGWIVFEFLVTLVTLD